MKLKTFNAFDMNEALRLVREELGDDAIILSSTRNPGGRGVKVVAAADRDETPGAGVMALNQARKNGSLRDVEKILHFHGVPTSLREKIIETARYIDFTDQLGAFSKSFDVLYGFQPIILDMNMRPILLVGPPGVGKTITTAKLVTEARLKKLPVSVATIDTRRAGGVEQLKAFTDILDVPLYIAETPVELKDILEGVEGALIIDSFGANPYDESELSELAPFVYAGDVEPILVISAGGDVHETAETASAFAPLGVRRLLVTRVGSARRFGGLLTAANAAGLAFANISTAASVPHPIERLDSQKLAALLLKHALTGKKP